MLGKPLVCFLASFVSRFLNPPPGFLKVPINTIAIPVEEANMVLGNRLPPFGSGFQPCHCGLNVALYAVTS